jgi:hypothetical protein
MVTEQEYLAALATISEYKEQLRTKTQQAFNLVEEDLKAYFTDTGQLSMLDFELFIDMNGVMEVAFKAIENIDLTGDEPFLAKLEEIGKKYDIILRVPYYDLMK